ncbi:MAG: glycosyltransferase, partial [Clostridia bacterium]|nr:glycosyltransferase [Clostridia bacterium]
MRILLTGGGTAGHINPAIAIANYIKEKEPGSEILFIGTKDGMEKTLVPKSGYNIEFIKVHGFERSLSLANIKNVFEAFFGIVKSKKIIKKFKPDIAIGTGGYVTGPVLMGAAELKIPTIVHESNAYP